MLRCCVRCPSCFFLAFPPHPRLLCNTQHLSATQTAAMSAVDPLEGPSEAAGAAPGQSGTSEPPAAQQQPAKGQHSLETDLKARWQEAQGRMGAGAGQADHPTAAIEAADTPAAATNVSSHGCDVAGLTEAMQHTVAETPRE
ncbi:hypothetical protein ABPG75_003569 [Micractinium tetrahymenae]